MANMGGRYEGKDEGAGRRRLLGLFLGLILVSVVLTGLVWREPGAVTPLLPKGPEGLSGLYGVMGDGVVDAKGVSATGSGVGDESREGGSAPASEPRPWEARSVAPGPMSPPVPALSVSFPLESGQVFRAETALGVEASWALPRSLDWEHPSGDRVSAGTLRSVPLEQTPRVSRYADAYTGIQVDVEYVPAVGSVKESFILKSPPTPPTGTSTLAIPFDIDVPGNLRAVAGNTTLSEAPLETSGAVEFLRGNDSVLRIGEPLVYEVGREEAVESALYRASSAPGRLHLELRVPVSWLLDPARTYPVAIDPSLGTGGFAQYWEHWLTGSLGKNTDYGGVATGFIDGATAYENDTLDAVFMALNADTDLFEYFVCADFGVRGSCTLGPKRTGPSGTVDHPGSFSDGAGVALGDLDGNGRPEAVFTYVDVLGDDFRYWVCRDIDITGACRGGWNPQAGWHSLAINVPIFFPSTDHKGADVALVDIDGGYLDAVFMAVDNPFAAGNQFVLVACLNMTVDGACERHTLPARVEGITLSDVTRGAGLAAANIVADARQDLILMALDQDTGGFAFWVCGSLRVEREVLFDVAKCDVSPRKFTKGIGLGLNERNRGAGVALASDLSRARDINHNGALDAIFMWVNDIVPDSQDDIRYFTALDGLVEYEYVAETTSNDPFVPYMILHDPSGDGSYSEASREFTNQVEVSWSLQRGRTTTTDWEVKVFLGQGGSQSTSFTSTRSGSVVTTQIVGQGQSSSKNSGDPRQIGPGYGDVILGQNWTTTYRFFRRTVDLYGVRSSSPYEERHVQLEGYETITVGLFRDAGDPRYAAAFALDLGFNNTRPSDPTLAEWKWNEAYHTGEARGPVSQANGTTTTRAVDWVVEMSHETYTTLEVELSLGLGEFVSLGGIGGHARSGVRTTFALGQSAGNAAQVFQSMTYVLADADTSADAGGDTLRSEVWVDRAFGTWHFWTDESRSFTSGPHEPWTGKADTMPPRLHSVTVDSNVITYRAGAPNAPDFRLAVNGLEDAAGIRNATVVFRRDDPFAVSGDAEKRVEFIPSGDPRTLTVWSPETRPSVQGLQGTYIVDVWANDTEGNMAYHENVGVLTVFEHDVVEGAETKVPCTQDEPLRRGLGKSVEFNLDADNRNDLILNITTDLDLSDCSTSVVQYNVSNPSGRSLFGLNDSIGASLGVVMQIEASRNLDDAILYVEICISYDERDIPKDGAGNPLIDVSDLEIRWFNESSGLWEGLPRPRPVDSVNRIVCGISTHFSFYGPLGNWLPIAVFGFASATVVEGIPLSVDGGASFDLDGVVVAHAWDFGDGSPPAAGAAASHAYGDDGTYVVTLTVTDNRGAYGSASAAVTVSNAPPSAAFTLLPAGPEGTALTLGVQATDPGSDDLTLAWDFGDGTPGTAATRYNDEPANTPDPLPSPVGTFPFLVQEAQAHAYGDNGLYHARVTVTDDDGGTAVIEGDVIVANAPPSVVLSTTAATVLEGTVLALSANTTDPGSDDITLEWDWGDGGQDGSTEHNDPTGIPDPPQSPWGTFPVAFMDARAHAYGDDVTLAVTLAVTDDDGARVVLTVGVVVTNEAPQVTATVGGGDEGSPLPFTATATDPGSDDLAFAWEWGDGATESRTHFNDGVGPDPFPSPGGTFPFTAADSGTHTWGDDGTYGVTLTVSDDDGGAATLTQSVLVVNVPPSVSVGLDAAAYAEADPTAATADFLDPGSDDVTLSWSWAYGPSRSTVFFNDGLGPDPPQSPWGTFPFAGTDAMSHTYGDNGDFLLTVRACDDDGGCGETFAVVVVENVDPEILDVQAYALADLTLRVAGEKWHDVRLDVVDVRGVTATASVVREPGSPDEQSATVPDIRFSVLGDGRIVVSYTPLDDPPNGNPNGGSPVQVTVAFEDGTSVDLHHNFNARQPGTWTWTIDDLRAQLPGLPLHFEVTGADIGSDDLTFAIEFGDGASFTATAFNDGLGPDPSPSPAVNPITATTTTAHAYAAAGTYTIQVTLTDDDGGTVAVTVAAFL